MSCSLKVSAWVVHLMSASHLATWVSDQDLRTSRKGGGEDMVGGHVVVCTGLRRTGAAWLGGPRPSACRKCKEVVARASFFSPSTVRWWSR
jgi:hypothetical protein